MSKGRLEAFSDGVIAILITILVLELKTPHGADLHALRAVLPQFSTYLLSFVFLGIYWNNHHHLLHATTHVNGAIMWANLHLLFWLSLVPFSTGWMGEFYTESLPTATYGAFLLLSGASYWILQRAIIASQGPHSKLAAMVGSDVKARASTGLYATAVPLAFVRWWLSDIIYVVVALIWLVPDRRIETRMHDE
jgi:uncharacterized membrane protein